MADWSMEPTAPWAPCDLQLVEWNVEPAVCSPGLLAVECASTQKFCDYLETSIPVSKEGQLVEYDPVEAAEHEFIVDLYKMEMKNDHPIHVFKDVADEYKIDIDNTKWKIHEYPAGIQALNLNERYTVPMLVAIGPYHRNRDNLKQTEKVKYVAAYNCIKNSGCTIQRMYSEVVSKANVARQLYGNAVVEGITDKDFLPMLFFDACFLVQYMICMSDPEADIDDSLCHFFNSNDDEIFHDIMLLENQLPWPVVQAIMEFVDVPLKEFIDSLKGCLQDRKDPVEKTSILIPDPPHLLGLLRFYIVGENKTKPKKKPERNTISFSLSAIELAEIGITLKPCESNQLIHMGLKTEGNLFAELYLAPLSLSSARESWLVNMAAHELCTTSNFQGPDARDEDSAVCSYLLLLAMLVGREEDVQELRAKGILQGGAFTNKEALAFLTRVQGLRLGSSYLRVMKDIEDYRSFNRPIRANLHARYYKNSKNIACVVSAFITIVTLLGTYLGIKK